MGCLPRGALGLCSVCVIHVLRVGSIYILLPHRLIVRGPPSDYQVLNVEPWTNNVSFESNYRL